jgi:predicted NBD/HSP70 family sugar kinase
MTIPTDAELLVQAQIDQLRRQAKWETPRAVAMIALALAAIVVAGHLVDLVFPPKPLAITVHFDQPIAVHLDQPVIVHVEPK